MADSLHKAKRKRTHLHPLRATYTYTHCPENRRYGCKRPYAYRFVIVCNGIIKYRQPENRQGVVGKLCEYGYIRYSKLIENGAFSRYRKRICCEQNKTPQDKGKANRVLFLSRTKEN